MVSNCWLGSVHSGFFFQGVHGAYYMAQHQHSTDNANISSNNPNSQVNGCPCYTTSLSLHHTNPQSSYYLLKPSFPLPSQLHNGNSSVSGIGLSCLSLFAQPTTLSLRYLSSSSFQENNSVENFFPNARNDNLAFGNV